MVYVISDIHGQLSALEDILEQIHLTKDDFIYFLGDYVDWGNNSIGVIKKCMELEENGQAKCLLGNHDLFFLEQLEYEDELITKGEPIELSLDSYTWMQNRGHETYESYCKLPIDEKRKIQSWLESLDYTCELSLNGKEYLLCHSIPQMQLDKTDREFYHNRYQSVWDRDYDSFPFSVMSFINGDIGFQLTPYSNPKIYDCYIHGHTINKYYLPDNKGNIYTEVAISDQAIAMDCGAKCIGYSDINPDWECYSLACLNLSTMEKYHSFVETKDLDMINDEIELLDI